MNLHTLCVVFVLMSTTLGLLSGVAASAPDVIPLHTRFDNQPTCGTVYDGLTNGRFDMQIQTSTTSIGANWMNFGSNVLFYEWAIISDRVRIPSFRTGRCVDSFRGAPDIQSWTLVQKATFASNSKVHLEIGRQYFVLVRATFRGGIQVVAVSDGVTIIDEKSVRQFERSTSVESETKSQTHSHEQRYIVNQPGAKEACSTNSCPLDEDNRCRAAAVKVSAYLQEFYGPPNWERENLAIDPIFVIYDSRFAPDLNNNDDDDDTNTAWYIAPIVGGVLLILCCVLLLLLLGAIIFTAALPEPAEKPQGESINFAEAEREKKGYGLREGVGTGEATTGTRVEFPDTQVRRLSLSHPNEGGPAEIAESRSPRRKHPIMTSTSASFRDYNQA